MITAQILSPLYVGVLDELGETGDCLYDTAVQYRDVISQAFSNFKTAEYPSPNLMRYFSWPSDYYMENQIRSKIETAFLTAVVENGRLCSCLNLELDSPLSYEESLVLQEQMEKQYRDGWGEAFELQDIRASAGESIYARLYHDGDMQMRFISSTSEADMMRGTADEVRLKNQSRMASDMPACIELLRSLEHYLGTGKSLLGEWMQTIYETNPDFTEAPVEVAKQIVSAFREVDRAYGNEFARNLYYQADIVLPTEIVAAGRYLSVGGKYEDLHSLAAIGWFMDDFQSFPHDKLLQAVNYMNNGGSADGIYDVFSTEVSPNPPEQHAPGISR